MAVLGCPKPFLQKIFIAYQVTLNCLELRHEPKHNTAEHASEVNSLRGRDVCGKICKGYGKTWGGYGGYVGMGGYVRIWEDMEQIWGV